MWRRIVVVGCAAVVTVAAACSKDSTSSPSEPPAGGTTITITAAGASPRNLTVPPGTQITFINNDTVAHDMFSDPHPEHTDCPEFDSVGHLAPGTTRQTKNLTAKKSSIPVFSRNSRHRDFDLFADDQASEIRMDQSTPDRIDLPFIEHHFAGT
jgi:plastocyanin